MPALTVTVLGDADSEKFGTLTVSVTLTECVGLPLLSVPVMVTVYAPAGVELVVLMVRVDDPEPPPIEAGLKLAVAPEGKPLALSATVPVYPLIGLTLAV